MSYIVAPSAASVGFTSASSGMAILSSVFFFGEATAATASSGVSLGAFGGGADATPAKSNSRLPSASSTYKTSASAANPVLIVFSLANFSRSAWRPSRRPLVMNGDGMGVALGSLTDNFIFVDESDKPTTRRRTIRSTRNGGFLMPDMVIHNHQKTGGGAFQIHAPHFDNDITWIDPSAWRNGSTQNEAWEINLFGNVGSPSLNIGQAVKRAAVW
jgi:hypothetical protein